MGKLSPKKYPKKKFHDNVPPIAKNLRILNLGPTMIL